VKNKDHLVEFRLFFWYFFVRATPVVIVCMVVFVGTIQALVCEGQTCPPTLSEVFVDLTGSSWTTWSLGTQWAVHYAQNTTLFAFVFYTIVLSSTLLHRNLPVRTLSPLSNSSWVISIVVVLVLQLIFSALSFFTIPRSDRTLDHVSLANVPVWVYIIGFFSVIPIFVLQEIMKRPDRANFQKFQKRSKLMFNTKLGMHSPV